MKNILIILLAFFTTQGAFAKSKVQDVNLQVTENGFEPSEVKIKPGTHVVLHITRKTNVTCATNVVIKEKNIKKELPLNQQVDIDLGKLKKGDLRYACGMDMITGHLIVE